MNRLLDGIDAWVQRSGLGDAVGAPERYAPTDMGAVPRPGLALGTEVRSVIWATGFRPDHRWLHVPAFGRDGALQHDRGVIAPGLVALGLPFLRRRKSSFIHGAEDHLRELAEHLATHLAQTAPCGLPPWPCLVKLRAFAEASPVGSAPAGRGHARSLEHRRHG